MPRSSASPTARYLYRDLGSLNGSFLRGERVGEHLLGEGDELTLGSTQLLFHEQSAVGGGAASG